MTSPTLDFLRIIQERGFLHQCTDMDAIREAHASRPITAYIGFDCTATSLHVGSLIQIMVLRWLQKTSNKPIVLMGGGTTKVGDPSGKDESRKLLDDAAIAANMEGIKRTFSQFNLAFEDAFDASTSKALMVNNDDWLSKINYIEFLRDYGRHFSVNRMMSMDSVKLRLEREQNLSFLEFNYMILQAYDFVELNKRYGCRLQIGGSDQWGNIVNGVDLGQKLVSEKISETFEDLKQREDFEVPNYTNSEKKVWIDKFLSIVKMQDTARLDKFIKDSVGTKVYEYVYKLHSNLRLFGLTTPLITTSSGAKMGKTANGAIWLDAAMCSPYDYWQFWRNTEDADVGRFLRFFTELPMEHVRELEKAQGAAINDVKKILADEATALCHGKEAAAAAAETAHKVFVEGGAGGELPEIVLSGDELTQGIPAYALLHKAGLAASGGEARKLIRGKGAKLNDEPLEDENQLITAAHLTDEGFIKLSAGKKRHVLVKLQ